MRRITEAFPALILALVLSVALSGCGIVDRITGNDKDKLEPLKPNPVPSVTEKVRLSRVWSSSVGGGGQRGLRPVMIGGDVFLANGVGDVAGINVESGSTLWRKDVDISISGGVGAGEGLVLVGGLDGEVVALDQRDGTEVWRSHVDSEVLAPPRGANGVVVVRTIDGGVTGLSSATGDRRWHLRREVPSLTLRGESPPLIDQGVAVMGFADGKLAAVKLDDGALMWEVSVARPSGTNEVERMIDVDASPLRIGNVLYVISFQGNITAYALGANQTMWSRDISSYTDVDADADNLYVSDSNGRVHALNRTTGEELWVQDKLLRRRLSGPVAIGDYLCVGDFEGYLYVLDKRDGSFVGLRDVGSRIEAQPLVSGNRVIVKSEDGSIGAFTIEAIGG